MGVLARILALSLSLVLGLVLSLILRPSPSRAQPLGTVNGTMELTAVQADVDDESRDTVRQQYTVNLSRSLLPYLDVRGSLRYFRFDLDSSGGLGSIREEIQPAGELAFHHPLFRLHTTAYHRRASLSLAPGDLVTDDISIDLRSRSLRWPLLHLSYDDQNITDESLVVRRETRDRRFQAGFDHSRGDHQVSYNFTRRNTENVVSGLESRQNDHLARYTGNLGHALGERSTLTVDYVFDRSSRVDEVVGNGRILERLPIAVALFAVDASPESDPLEPLADLADGNTVSVTDPAIEIGGSSIDRNLGVDLGFSRPVSAIYVYVNRLSGESLGWSVYVSEDNLNWQLFSSAPTVVFQRSSNRYEIGFSTVKSRYVKVVNGRGNEIADVQATEIEAFEESPDTGELRRTSSAHRLDSRLSYQLTERVGTSLDASYRRDPGEGSVGTRTDLNYALRTTFEQSTSLSHHLRWEQSWQRFNGRREDLRDDVASYSVLFKPLPTVRASSSARSRLTRTGGIRTAEIHSLSNELDLTPLDGLDLSLGNTLSRQIQLDFGTRSDLWSLRGTADATLRRSVHALITWTHQQTTSRPRNELRIRRSIGVNLDLRPTSAIFARGSVNLIDDRRFSRTQSYQLGWNLGRRASLTGQVFLDDASGDASSDRYAINLAIDIGNRGDLFLRYSLNDLSGSGGSRTEAVEQGVRMVF